MPVSANLYYAQHTAGEPEQKPVILIHDAGSTHQSWPAELRRLPGQTVFALDLPGHGNSGGVGYQSVGAYCGALVEFLASLNLYQAVFVGHGLGAAISLTLALDFPQHVAGLGLISAGASFRVPPNLTDYLSSPTTLLNARELIQRLRLSPYTPARAAQQAEEILAKTRPSVLYGDWLACEQFDLHDRLSELSLPALVVCGEQDRLTPPGQARHLAQVLENAQLRLIRAAGHLALQEQPAALAAALTDYLGALETWRQSVPLPVALPESARRKVGRASQDE